MERSDPARPHGVEAASCERGRAESVAVGLIVLGLCSLSCFVIAWWGTAFLHITGLAPFPERAVALSALAGLALGLAVGMLNLRRLTRRFYTAPVAIVVCVYLFWAVAMTAFLMGLPPGLLGLGLAAGVYAGRRHARTPACRSKAAASLARTSVFVASATAAVSLLMGALAVADRATLAQVLSLAGLGGLGATTAGQAAVVVVAVPAIFVIQYWLTLTSARWAARVGTRQPGRRA